MPDGKKYKGRVRIIEGSEGNQLHIWGFGVGLEMEGVPFTPTPQERARMGKTIACNICSVFHDFVKRVVISTCRN